MHPPDLPHYPTSSTHPDIRVSFVCAHCHSNHAEARIVGIGGGRTDDGAMLWRVDRGNVFCDSCNKQTSVTLPQCNEEEMNAKARADELECLIMEKVRPVEAAIRKKAGFEPYGSKSIDGYARQCREAVNQDRLIDAGSQCETAYLIQQLEAERNCATLSATDDIDEAILKDNCLRIAMQALHQIISFDHCGGPNCTPNAPLMECDCFNDSMRDLAVRARERIDLRCGGIPDEIHEDDL